MYAHFYRYGPLIRLWCMRYEGKHKQFKQVARRSTYKNVCLTLSKFHQRQQAFELSCNNAFATVHIETGASELNLLDTVIVLIVLQYTCRKEDSQFTLRCVYIKHPTKSC